MIAAAVADQRSRVPQNSVRSKIVEILASQGRQAFLAKSAPPTTYRSSLRKSPGKLKAPIDPAPQQEPLSAQEARQDLHSTDSCVPYGVREGWDFGAIGALQQLPYLVRHANSSLKHSSMFVDRLSITAHLDALQLTRRPTSPKPVKSAGYLQVGMNAPLSQEDTPASASQSPRTSSGPRAVRYAKSACGPRTEWCIERNVQMATLPAVGIEKGSGLRRMKTSIRWYLPPWEETEEGEP